MANHLERFTEGERVRIIDLTHPLFGWTGRTRRVCIGGLHPWHRSPDGTVWNIPEAWVEMAKQLPVKLRKFTDPARRRHIKLRADQCERVP